MSEAKTLTAGPGADSEQSIPITSVALSTGYNSQYLRRLELAGSIPQSHKIGGIIENGVHKGGIRAWSAREVEKILEYKGRMIDLKEKHMAKISKKGNAARATA